MIISLQAGQYKPLHLLPRNRRFRPLGNQIGGNFLGNVRQFEDDNQLRCFVFLFKVSGDFGVVAFGFFLYDAKQFIGRKAGTKNGVAVVHFLPVGEGIVVY